MIRITDGTTNVIRLGGGGGIQISGPSGPCAALNWRYIGADYWSQYQACINATIAGGGTALDTLATPTGTYPGGGAYYGGVLLPDGRVYCVPHSATTARIYNPITDTLATPTGTYPGGAAYAGGVLLPDGRVYCVPHSATTARIYNPITDTLATPTGTYPGGGAYAGGVLLPDGRVYCVPLNATTARIYANTTAAFNANVVLSGYFNKL